MWKSWHLNNHLCSFLDCLRKEIRFLLFSWGPMLVEIFCLFLNSYRFGLHLRKTLEDSLLQQGHSKIRNGEPKHPAVVVPEGQQKNYGIVGIRNVEPKHSAVVVPEGW